MGLSAPECHKYFPKADVNKIIVLRRNAARQNTKYEGGGEEKTGEEMKGDEEMRK